MFPITLPRVILAMNIAITLILLGLTAAACTTPRGTASTPKSPERLYYVLRKADPVTTVPPLPLRTDIFVDWYFDDGSKSSTLGFRGWDFDRNGHFEMMDVMAIDGEVQTRLFDYNGDGRVDRSVDPASL